MLFSRHRAVWAIPILLLYSSIANSTICSETVYGQVNPSDCVMAMNEIPYALLPATDSQARSPRQFSEPQFQSPKFDSVSNQFSPQAIVQLPKLWKHSE